MSRQFFFINLFVIHHFAVNTIIYSALNVFTNGASHLIRVFSRLLRRFAQPTLCSYLSSRGNKNLTEKCSARIFPKFDFQDLFHLRPHEEKSNFVKFRCFKVKKIILKSLIQIPNLLFC